MGKKGEIPHRCAARNDGVSLLLSQQAFDAIGQDGLRGFLWNETAEQAEVGVDGNVVVGDFDGAFDGRAEQAPLCGESEEQSGALPGSLLDVYFYGEIGGGSEQVVKGAIDGLHDFGFRAIVR